METIGSLGQSLSLDTDGVAERDGRIFVSARPPHVAVRHDPAPNLAFINHWVKGKAKERQPGEGFDYRYEAYYAVTPTDRAYRPVFGSHDKGSGDFGALSCVKKYCLGAGRGRERAKT